MDGQAPFSSTDALNTDRLARQPSLQTPPPRDPNPADSIEHVPGDLSVGLGCDDVRAHLSKHLRTPILDELYEQLWLVARKSGANIDPLHAQNVKGRTIVPTEDPNLHLLWNRNKIYVKPMPAFLLNHDFWLFYLRDTSRDPVPYVGISDRSVASGFLRSYSLLIQTPLDFALAKESHLIPKEIQWLKWSKFISRFRHMRDDEVAQRYHFGQLRLSRLHWAVRIFRPQSASTSWFYAIPHWSITEFVERATIPFIFVFASISLVLSSMQVVLSVPVEDLWYDDSDRPALQHASRAFWIFSIAVVLFGGLMWVLVLAIPAAALLWQLVWGFRHLR